MTLPIQSDLHPPLGNPGGPCQVIERIERNIRSPRLKDDLVEDVNTGEDLSNQAASKVYPILHEHGVGDIKQVEITSHGQYRMDLRGITVDDVRHAIGSLLQQMDEWRVKKSPAYERMSAALDRGDKIEWVNPKSALKIVLSPIGEGVVRLVSTFWKGVSDPPPPHGSCVLPRHASLAERVVARYLEARAISIDKTRLYELAKTLQIVIERKTKGVEGSLGKRVLTPGAPYDIRAVDGSALTVYVRLESVLSQSPYYIVGGGMGHASGKTVVVVHVNGSIDAQNINRASQGHQTSVADQIYPVLIHEATHAADIFAKGEGVAKHMTMDEARDNAAYYNNPSEVRAYMQEVVHEAERNFPHFDKFLRAFKGPGKALEVILKQCSTWVEVSPHWTERNKQLVIKSVAQHLDEWQEHHKTGSLLMDKLAYAVVARYKSKVKTEAGNTVYTYSARQIANRNKKKALRIEALRKSIGDLRRKVKRDLKSDDPEKSMVALAVALIDHTYERPGNKDSADEREHYGVTGWKKKHVTFSGKGALIKYTGKAGVKHEKKVTDAAIKQALREAYEACDKDSANIFSGDWGTITADKVNEYLEPFDITAKDLRGFHANREMQERLKIRRSDGGKLPSDKKAAAKILKAEFLKALEETAEAVGHEPATLRSQYLLPGIEALYMKNGTVSSKLSSLFEEDGHLEDRVIARHLLELL